MLCEFTLTIGGRVRVYRYTLRGENLSISLPIEDATAKVCRTHSAGPSSLELGYAIRPSTEGPGSRAQIKPVRFVAEVFDRESVYA